MRPAVIHPGLGALAKEPVQARQQSDALDLASGLWGEAVCPCQAAPR